SFTVSNRGSEPLEFKLSASCGCAFVRPMAGTLAPGESLAISLGIRLPPTINSEKSAQILIRSNDPRQPQVVCAATARAPAPWEVSPTHVNFGYVLRQELAQPPWQRVVVRPGRGKNALPTSAIRIQAPATAYRVRWRARPDGALVIDISLRPGLSDGRYTSTLYLGHAEDPTLISIPLDAELGPAIALVPARVRLVRDEGTGTYRPAPVIAVSQKADLAVPALAPVDWPAGVRLRDAQTEPARLRRFFIEAAADFELPPEGLQVVLRAGNTGQTLTLTLFAAVDVPGKGPLRGQHEPKENDHVLSP
ncbi:MAG: hypothetical protein K6T59_11530, partial [Bryobacteraceae bacterium]|nr:hypothetical protein [Bryobacteraceae bacterium]